MERRYSYIRGPFDIVPCLANPGFWMPAHFGRKRLNLLPYNVFTSEQRHTFITQLARKLAFNRLLILVSKLTFGWTPRNSC